MNNEISRIATATAAAFDKLGPIYNRDDVQAATELVRSLPNNLRSGAPSIFVKIFCSKYTDLHTFRAQVSAELRRV